LRTIGFFHVVVRMTDDGRLAEWKDNGRVFVPFHIVAGLCLTAAGRVSWAQSGLASRILPLDRNSASTSTPGTYGRMYICLRFILPGLVLVD